MTPDQLRIQELERQVSELVKSQQLLMSIFYNSSATKLYLKNTIAFDKESLVGFFGANPVKKQSAITAPSGGATVDTQARTAISTIITTLQNLGLTS